MISIDDLTGAWRLVSYTFTAEDGEVTHPYGPAPVGQILYTADGGMAAHIMAPGRPSAPRDLGTVDGETARALLVGYQSYSGTWRIEGDTVIHAVTSALVQDWVGTDQRRDAALAGDTLTLSAGGIRLGGKLGRSVIVWRRG